MIQEIKERVDFLERSIGKELNYDESLFSEGRVLLEDSNFLVALNEMSNPAQLRALSYTKFIDNCDLILETSEKIRKIKERIEYTQYVKTGNKYNFKKLKKIFEERNLKQKFPKFKFDKYEELVNNPVVMLKNFQGEEIHYDPFVVSKILVSINQLVFDEMDVRIVNVGKEGSGKSCFSSQIMYYYWWFMTEVGIISYPFDVKKLFFSSVAKLLEEQEAQGENDPGRIFCLDEGYELNRSNYRQEESINYKDSMRSDRKMLRVEIVNLPQLGELELAITQTRTNFIFEACLSNDKQTSTLKKGLVNFYIIPRGDTIYSRYQRREITAKEVINTLSAILKDKNDSYKGLPDSIIIDQIKFKNVWSFDKSVYDSFIKKENKLRRHKSKIQMTDYQAYIIWKRLPQTKHLGMFDLKNNAQKVQYKHFQKWRESIKMRFETNPELINKFELSEKVKNNND
jgi:hypothetical protein